MESCLNEVLLVTSDRSTKKCRDKYIGKKYNFLLIEDISFQNEYDNMRRRLYNAHCLCDCGTKKIFRLNTLKDSNCKSCGCSRKQRIIIPKTDKDYTQYIGKRFNKFIINKFSYKTKHNCFFECTCDCGKRINTRLRDLETGRSKNCGCARNAKLALNNKSRKFELGLSPINSVYCDYKKGAKKRNIDFDLSKEEFLSLIKQKCYYCGDDPANIKRSQHNQMDFVIYNGIDRKDNNIGYILNNCLPCCSFCNFSKRDNTQEYFFNKINKIYNNLLKNEPK